MEGELLSQDKQAEGKVKSERCRSNELGFVSTSTTVRRPPAHTTLTEGLSFPGRSGAASASRVQGGRRAPCPGPAEALPSPAVRRLEGGAGRPARPAQMKWIQAPPPPSCSEEAAGRSRLRSL